MPALRMAPASAASSPSVGAPAAVEGPKTRELVEGTAGRWCFVEHTPDPRSSPNASAKAKECQNPSTAAQASISKFPVLYIGTHDSIDLGEDVGSVEGL